MVEDVKPLAIQEDAFGERGKSWVWLLAFGVLSILAGCFGLGMAVFVTLASVFFYGIIILVVGGARLVQSLQCCGGKSRLWNVLVSLLYVLAGIVVLRNPLLVSGILTLFLAFAILSIGVMRSIAALQMRGHRGWIWVLIGGVAAIVLGIMILAKWPASSLVVIGTLISIELIFNGWATVAVAMVAKEAENTVS